MNLTKLLSTIDSEIASLTKARKLLAGLAATPVTRPKHKLSAAGRKKIAAAQKKRWAAIKKAMK